jgi:cation transport regulator ChaB
MGGNNISEDFKFSEFVVSSRFPDLLEGVRLSQNQKYRLYILAQLTIVPERIRSHVKTIITQGIRNYALFKALKDVGYKVSDTSQHFFNDPFDAAFDFYKEVKDRWTGKLDIMGCRAATYQAYCFIKRECRHGFGQMYWSKPDIKNPDSTGFVHIGAITPDHKGETWTVG